MRDNGGHRVTRWTGPKDQGPYRSSTREADDGRTGCRTEKGVTATTTIARATTSTTDPITGLPKPPVLEGHLSDAQSRSTATGSQILVIVADVDHFTDLADTRGWDAADQVLFQVASRFRSCLREQDMVSRMFGAMYAGVCEAVDDPAGPTAIVSRLTKAFARPYRIDGRRATVKVNVGTVFANPDELPERAIQRAEANL